MHFVSKHVRLSEPTTKIWMKIDLYFQRRRCSPMTIVHGNIRFTRIFAGVPWTVGVKRQWGNRKHHFRAFGRYVFGTLGNEANVIIRYYLAACRLFTDLKIHNLIWPFYVQFLIFTITNRVSAIGLHIYRRAIYRIFCCMTSPAEMCGSGPWIRDRQNIADPRKYCGSFVDEKLRALHRRNLNK